MIPLLEPTYTEFSIERVTAAIVENYIAVGPYIKEFEDRVASYIKTDHAIAVSSGTAALHLALLASPVEPGDEVIMPILSFVASANAVNYVGAYPWFIDVDEFCQLDAARVLEFLKFGCKVKDGKFYNRKTGRRVSAMMAVHLLGQPITYIDKLAEVAKECGLFVIEDCAQSFGASWDDNKVGSFGHIACFSFNGNKIITSGGGGMVTTNSQVFADEIRLYSSQWKTPTEQHRFYHDRVGYNYKMPNLLAAVGCSQLDFLDRIITKKRTIREMYKTYLDLPVLGEHPRAFSTFWLNAIYNKDYPSRDTVIQLKKKGIESRMVYTPMHLFPMYSHCTDLKEAKAFGWYNNGFVVPSSVNLELETIKHICSIIKEIV